MLWGHSHGCKVMLWNGTGYLTTAIGAGNLCWWEFLSGRQINHQSSSRFNCHLPFNRFGRICKFAYFVKITKPVVDCQHAKWGYPSNFNIISSSASIGFARAATCATALPWSAGWTLIVYRSIWRGTRISQRRSFKPRKRRQYLCAAIRRRFKTIESWFGWLLARCPFCLSHISGCLKN